MSTAAVTGFVLHIPSGILGYLRFLGSFWYQGVVKPELKEFRHPIDRVMNGFFALTASTPLTFFLAFLAGQFGYPATAAVLFWISVATIAIMIVLLVISAAILPDDRYTEYY